MRPPELVQLRKGGQKTFFWSDQVKPFIDKLILAGLKPRDILVVTGAAGVTHVWWSL